MALPYKADESSIIKIQFNSSAGFSLTYIDLMSHLKYMPDAHLYDVYTVIPLDSNGEPIRELTDRELAINSKIEGVSSFNASVYTVIQAVHPVLGTSTEYAIDNNIYDHISINTFFMERPAIDPNQEEGGEGAADIPDYKIISLNKSILFNNTKSLDVAIDSLFPVYDEFGKQETDDEGKPLYGPIPADTKFYLYITVETTNGKIATIFYEFTYVEPEEEELESGDNSNAENDWNMGFEEEDLPVEFTPIELSDDRWADYVFLNTVSVNQLRKLPDSTLHCYDGISRVYISPLCPDEFVFRLNVRKNSGSVAVYTFNYKPKKLNITAPYLPHVTKMNNPDVSYALVRTNPKLTGNVKVVVDSDSNLYLDTFKISDTLSSRRYRHIKVGANSYYGSTLMKYFKDIPSSEFYKVEDKCCNLFTTVQSYKDQYYDVYRCGVKTNTDKLYSENFAMLAPLCVKRVLPDFFLVFRVDKSLEDYNESMTDDEKLEYFLRFGKLVKSFDMRQDSDLGKYVRTIYDNAKDSAGDMYVSYDTDNYNKFIGISLDRGMVASMYESIHLERSVKSQVALNDFYTSGFERNHIVSKDIINFEFMFDDYEPGLFSIKTYFGLYVKVNTEDNTFSCIGSSTYNTTTSIEGSNKTEKVEKTKYSFDTSIHTYPIGTDLRYSDKGTLIYGLTTPKEFIRLDSGLYDAPCIKDYELRPYKNLLTSKVEKFKVNNVYNSFVTLQLNKPFEVGEHIRVIDTNNSIMYEVITSDIDNARTTQGFYMDENHLSEITTNYYNEYSTKYTIYRISMFIKYRSTEESKMLKSADATEELVKEHIDMLYAAFKKFSKVGGVTAYKKEGTKLSLISSAEHVLFQRICAPSGFISSLNTYLEETKDEDEAILFYGQIYPEKVILNIDNMISSSQSTPTWKVKQYAYLYPLHFDIVGNRMSYIMSFVPTSSISDKEYFYSVNIIDKSIFDTTTLLYDKYSDDKSTSSYTKYAKIPVHLFANGTVDKTGEKDNSIIERYVKELDYVESFDDFNKYFINIQNPVLQHGGQVSIYSSYPLNAGVCSILQYKDFDFEVLDSDSAILNSSVAIPIGSSGEFAEKSFFNCRPDDTEDGEVMSGEEEEEPLEYNKVYIPKIEDLEGYNPKQSMFVQGDAILVMGEEEYVIKHMTFEEFKADIITRIRNVGTKTVTMQSPIIDATDTNITLTNLITEEQKEWIMSILGYGDLSDYAGYVLRPFIPGTRVYDQDYVYYNHKVSFVNVFPADFTGDKAINTGTDLDDYSEFRWKYVRLNEEVDEKTGEYINPPIYVDENGNDYGLDYLYYDPTSEDSLGLVLSDAFVAPEMPGVTAGTNDSNIYYYFPLNDVLSRKVSPAYMCYKVAKMSEDDGSETEQESYEISQIGCITQPHAAGRNNTPLDLNNAAFTSFNVASMFGGTQEERDTVRNKTRLVEYGKNGKILQRIFASFTNDWVVEAFDIEDPEGGSSNASSSSGITSLEELPYSTSPIRNSSEENIKDYINKYSSFSDELANLSFSKTHAANNENRSKYLSVLYNNNHTRFDIPLVSPCACKWKGNGTDARIENMRIMYDYESLVDSSSYYIVGDDSYDSYLGVLYLKERNTTACGSKKNYEFNKYINKSLDDTLFNNENKDLLGGYCKDFILYGEGALDDILYDSYSQKTKFSTAYLSGQNTLEFISGGIKFKIRSSNDNVIDFSKYTGYSAVFVNLPINNISVNTQTELIIDELKREIMLIWYSYCNTLRYGIKLEQMDNATEVFKNFYPIKLNYTKQLSDIICTQLVDIRNASIYNAALIEDTMGLYLEKTVNPWSEHVDEKGELDCRGHRLCDKEGYIYLSSMGINTDEFTKSNNICITSKIFYNRPVTANCDITLPYYAKDGYLTPIVPFIWHNNVNAKYTYHEELSNGAIDKYIYDVSDNKDCILYTDDIVNAPSAQRTIKQLTDMLDNYSVYVKTANGTKDYSTVKNLLNIEIVDPIEYNREFLFTRQSSAKVGTKANPVKKFKVHSTYATPVMKDIFNFNYSSTDIANNTKAFNTVTDDNIMGSSSGGNFIIDMDTPEDTGETTSVSDSLESIFEKSFDGANVSIKSVNPIKQIWINKYTEDSNYCSQGIEDASTGKVDKTMLLSVDVVDKVSVLDDSWESTSYRKYEITRGSEITENYSKVKGYLTGVELKTFLNSKGVILKSKDQSAEVVIDNWKNTYINEDEGYIRLDVNDSIVYSILQMTPFIESWQPLYLTTNEYKINYIKNYILDFININNKTKFVLRKDKTMLKSLRFNGIYNDELEEVKNMRNELRHENGKYYMYVYPTEKHMYYAKMIITL